ncbi:hypothetical protein BDN70DRAFT_42864 [Pholiota conissans]|uniref:F-box domain-containing protein n=1 Tax=Pholiota conissans TaxID=109636 RepID=A0A9P5Z1M7_9AGAR|nr:hypothetical protein BDN70DRAFT_42864 [Pholiota conissans]
MKSIKKRLKKRHSTRQPLVEISAPPLPDSEASTAQPEAAVFSPISALPPELILKIMFLAGRRPYIDQGRRSLDSSWDTFQSYSSESESDILRCSQVCHAWRYISLFSRLLWSSYFTLRPSMSVEWLQELLCRIGAECPLSVDTYVSNKVGLKTRRSSSQDNIEQYNGDLDSTKENIARLSRRLSQIKHLLIRVDHEHELESAVLPFQSCGSAPNLSSFGLLVKYNSYHPPSPHYFSFDANVFGDNTHFLKHMKFRNCGLDLNSPLYRQLTTLDMFYIEQDSRAPSASQWVSVLATCTALVSWSFEGFMSNSVPEPATGSYEISLPSLVHLQLHLHIPDAVIIFSHLKFPSLRSFDVTVGENTPESWPLEFQTLSNILGYHIDKFLPTLKRSSPWHISFLDNNSIRFTKDEPVSDGIIEYRPAFTIQYRIPPDRYINMISAINSLTSMLSPHGLTEVEDLTITIIHPFSVKIIPDDQLVAALSQLTRVRTLRVGFYTAKTNLLASRSSFFTPQCPSTRFAAGTSISPISLFPQLSYLYVQPIVPLWALKSLIVMRRMLQIPIRTVHFSDKDSDVSYKRTELPSKEKFDELREVGNEVIMDDDLSEVLASTSGELTCAI